MDSYLNAYKKLPTNPWRDYYYNPANGNRTLRFSTGNLLDENNPKFIYYQKLKCRNQPFMSMSDAEIIVYLQKLVERFQSAEVQAEIKGLDDKYAQRVYDTKVKLHRYSQQIEKIKDKISGKRFLLRCQSCSKKRKKRLRKQITVLRKKERRLQSRSRPLAKSIDSLQNIYAARLVPLTGSTSSNRIDLIREFSGAYPLIIMSRLEIFSQLSKEILAGIFDIYFYAPGGPVTR